MCSFLADIKYEPDNSISIICKANNELLLPDLNGMTGWQIYSKNKYKTLINPPYSNDLLEVIYLTLGENLKNNNGSLEIFLKQDNGEIYWAE